MTDREKALAKFEGQITGLAARSRGVLDVLNTLRHQMRDIRHSAQWLGGQAESLSEGELSVDISLLLRQIDEHVSQGLGSWDS